MDDSHSKTAQISRLMGNSLIHDVSLTNEELGKLLHKLEQTPQRPHSEIPARPGLAAQRDPRLDAEEYRDMLLARKLLSELTRYPGLTVRKLVIVLDLDWTLVHAIAYPDHQALPQLSVALMPLRFRCGARSFLVVARQCSWVGKSGC